MAWAVLWQVSITYGIPPILVRTPQVGLLLTTFKITISGFQYTLQVLGLYRIGITPLDQTDTGASLHLLKLKIQTDQLGLRPLVADQQAVIMDMDPMLCLIQH